jgi:hypothetical protein
MQKIAIDHHNSMWWCTAIHPKPPGLRDQVVRCRASAGHAALERFQRTPDPMQCVIFWAEEETGFTYLPLHLSGSVSNTGALFVDKVDN